jgi:hypothetical protein
MVRKVLETHAAARHRNAVAESQAGQRPYGHSFSCVNNATPTDLRINPHRKHLAHIRSPIPGVRMNRGSFGMLLRRPSPCSRSSRKQAVACSDTVPPPGAAFGLRLLRHECECDSGFV